MRVWSVNADLRAYNFLEVCVWVGGGEDEWSVKQVFLAERPFPCAHAKCRGRDGSPLERTAAHLVTACMHLDR